MDIKTLSQQTGVSEQELTLLINELNESHNLHIPDTFTKGQYDILRSLLDSDYLIKRIKSLSPRSNFALPTVLDKWIRVNDLSGLSTRDIEDMAHGGPYKGLKQVSRAMRENGYESKVIYLGGDMQGRRWFKTGDTVDNFKAAKVKAKHLYEIEQGLRFKESQGCEPSFL